MDQKEFADRYNHLTGVFLRKFSEDKQSENIVFSPFSILSLLSILADATDGTTRQEVWNLLSGSASPKGFPKRLKSVRKVLSRKDDYYCSWPNDTICDRNEHMHTANVVFVQKDYWSSICPDFQKHLTDIYDGLMLSSTNLAIAMKNCPFDAMPDLLPLLQEIANSDSILAMLNTVFFQAMWQYPYEEKEVRAGIFHNTDRTDSKVTMLYGGGDSYVENDIATGFVKSFQQCDYSFMALLPRKKGPEALRALAETVDFRNLLDCQRDVILHSKMPEFSVSFRQDLNAILESLGIRKAFTPSADFSSISSEQLIIDRMIHQAKIDVDRNGAKASAATALICVGSLPPTEVKRVMIDRPFIFAIINEELKIPVFVGVVNQIGDEIDAGPVSSLRK